MTLIRFVLILLNDSLLQFVIACYLGEGLFTRFSLCFQVLVEKMGLPYGSHVSTSTNELLGMSRVGLVYVIYHLVLAVKLLRSISRGPSACRLLSVVE